MLKSIILKCWNVTNEFGQQNLHNLCDGQHLYSFEIVLLLRLIANIDSNATPGGRSHA